MYTLALIYWLFSWEGLALVAFLAVGIFMILLLLGDKK